MAGSALGAFARRVARAAASDRHGHGRGLSSAAARSRAIEQALGRHRRHRRRASSSSSAAGLDVEEFVLGALFGGMVTHWICRLGIAFLEMEAEARRGERLEAFLEEQLRKRERGEEITSFEKAWEEEVVARLKKLYQ